MCRNTEHMLNNIFPIFIAKRALQGQKLWLQARMSFEYYWKLDGKTEVLSAGS